MGNSNKKAKEKLIELYGPECFIEKLHLRPDREPKRYTGKKKDLIRLKQLTYHHIREKRNGGRATIENGALLSHENHQWFNKQPPEAQRIMNQAFQDYKRSMNVAIMQGATVLDAQRLNFDMSDCIEIPLEKDTVETKRKYNRAKVNRYYQKIIDEELEL